MSKVEDVSPVTSFANGVQYAIADKCLRTKQYTWIKITLYFSQTAHSLNFPKAIAPFNLPTSFFNEPQRHRGHREREIALPQLPKSDSCGALRYRTPSTSPNSELTSQCLRYRTLQLPKQQLSHFINFKHCLF